MKERKGNVEKRTKRGSKKGNNRGRKGKKRKIQNN